MTVIVTYMDGRIDTYDTGAQDDGSVIRTAISDGCYVLSAYDAKGDWLWRDIIPLDNCRVILERRGPHV